MGSTAPVDGLRWLRQLRLLEPSLIGTLALVLLAVVSSLYLSELTVRWAVDDTQGIERVRARLVAAANVKILMLDVETGQRGYLLTGNPAYLRPFDAAVGNLEKALAELRRLSPTAELAARIDRISDLATDFISVSRATTALQAADHRRDALEVVLSGRGKTIMDEMRAEFVEIERASEAEIADLAERQAITVALSQAAIILLGVLVIGLLATVARLFVKQAVREKVQSESALGEAKRMQDLVAARTLELSDMSSHLQTVVEREKAELARNLHDEMGGLITAAKMDLAWLNGALKSMDPEVLAKLEDVNTSLTEAMDMKRRVVESLRPALLDHFGLPAALQSFFEETCRKANLECATTIPEEMAALPQDLAIALFRVGQESLTNIVRHARAKRVELKVEAVGDEVHLVISDDGIGFDTAGRRFRHSHGISGMRHRVEGLGGQFTLESTPQQGTRIRIVVPREREEPGIAPFADAAP